MAKKDEPKEEVQEEPIVATELEEPKEQPKEEPEAPESPKEEESAPAGENQEEPKEETPEEQPEEPEQKMSRREQLRVQDLLKKYPNLAEPTVPQAPDFRTKVQADEEVYKTLEETTKDYGRDLLAEATQRANFNTWNRFLEMDDRAIQSKYPELDRSNSETYYKALSDAMWTKYGNAVGFNPGDPEKGIPASVQNPNISYADFVEAEMEFANELAQLKASESQKNIVRQAASTGLRPDGSSAKRLNLSKPPEQMTDEELQAVISQAGL